MKPDRFFLALLCASCAPAVPAPIEVPSAPLAGDHGETIDARRLAEGARLTVLVFFSPHCHCLEAHEARLRALYDRVRGRGVQFFFVDSGHDASRESDDDQARRRGLAFPILLDTHATLARALGAEYATYSVVLDSGGRVQYRGGIDTDKTHLQDDAIPYLGNAIDDLLAGRAPRVVAGKALGCALEIW